MNIFGHIGLWSIPATTTELLSIFSEDGGFPKPWRPCPWSLLWEKWFGWKKSTGKPQISWENRWFPVFSLKPIRQSIDLGIASATTRKWHQILSPGWFEVKWTITYGAWSAHFNPRVFWKTWFLVRFAITKLCLKIEYSPEWQCLLYVLYFSESWYSQNEHVKRRLYENYL